MEDDKITTKKQNNFYHQLKSLSLGITFPGQFYIVKQICVPFFKWQYRFGAGAKRVNTGTGTNLPTVVPVT